jgi:hypothetical protein
MSRLGPRRSFNLHIARRYNDIVDRRYRRHRVQEQGDTPRQGRLEQNLFFVMETSKLYQPHGSRLLSLHAQENVVSRVVFFTATCTCQSLPPRSTTRPPSTPQLPPHLHVRSPCASPPSILMHVQRSSATNRVHPKLYTSFRPLQCNTLVTHRSPCSSHEHLGRRKRSLTRVTHQSHSPESLTTSSV